MAIFEIPPNRMCHCILDLYPSIHPYIHLFVYVSFNSIYISLHSPSFTIIHPHSPTFVDPSICPISFRFHYHGALPAFRDPRRLRVQQPQLPRGARRARRGPGRARRAPRRAEAPHGQVHDLVVAAMWVVGLATSGEFCRWLWKKG